MTETKKKREVKQMVGRELEFDVVRKIHKQLDRLPDMKGAIRALRYVQEVTHEGSTAYAKQIDLLGQETRPALTAEARGAGLFP